MGAADFPTIIIPKTLSYIFSFLPGALLSASCPINERSVEVTLMHFCLEMLSSARF